MIQKTEETVEKDLLIEEKEKLSGKMKIAKIKIKWKIKKVKISYSQIHRVEEHSRPAAGARGR